MNFKEGTFLKAFFVLFLGMFLSISCSSASEDINVVDHDNGVCGVHDNKCGIVSGAQLLESENIEYNQSELGKCICKNNTVCNADILTLRQCLNEEGLTTYAYTVNESQLQTGDIIHYDFNDTGHYEYYIMNTTDLTGFTGYIITIRELKDQEQVPLQLQEKIHGQCPPCAALIACMEFPPCEIALEHLLVETALTTIWCAEHQKECRAKVGAAWARVERGNKKLGDELRQRHRGLFHG